MMIFDRFFQGPGGEFFGCENPSLVVWNCQHEINDEKNILKNGSKSSFGHSSFGHKSIVVKISIDFFFGSSESCMSKQYS